MKPIKTVLTYTIPAVLLAALIISVIWGRTEAARAEELETISEEYIGYCTSSCKRAGQELSDCVRSMRISLQKLRVTGSDANRVLALEDIVRESAEAEKLLSRLPQSQIKAMGLTAFLTRMGDYARSISKRLLAGESMDETDGAQLAATLDAISALSERLDSMIINGELPVGTEEFDYYDLPEGEEEEPEYPSLVYDGRFSEAAENAEPLGLTGEEGTIEQAQAVAENLAGVALEYAGMTEGRIPTYDFTADGTDVSVTVRGLMPRYYAKTPSSDSEGTPDEAEYAELISKGLGFLEKAGYRDMAPTFSEFRGGTAAITFIWNKDGIAVYPDSVKVWIDRATGELSGLDAAGYLTFHRERELAEPALGEEAAREAAAFFPDAEGKGLALIQLTPMTEALCWEFRCEFEGGLYAVFVNAQSGAEEAVLVIERDGFGERAV